MDRDNKGFILDVVNFMGSEGVRYKKSELYKVYNYTKRMLDDQRIMVISDNKEIKAVIFFSICEDYLKYLKKPTWKYLEHNSKGTYVYIEKAVSKSWDRGMRLAVQRGILKSYSQVKTGKWHRYGTYGDREVTTKEYQNGSI